MLFQITTRPKSNTAAIDFVAKNARNYYSKTTGAETLSVVQFVDAVVSQNGAQAAFNLTTPTAAAVVAALVDPAVGDVFEFDLTNPTGGAIVTMVGGAGVTLVGVGTVAIAANQHWYLRITNVGTPAIDMIRA